MEEIRYDKKQSILNAKRELSKYYKMFLIGGAEYRQSLTASYSFEPKSFTGATPRSMIEKQVVDKVDAVHYLCAVQETLENMNKYRRTLLTMRFVDEVPITQICKKLYKSKTSFYRDLDKALFDFALGYQNGYLLAIKS